MLFVVVPAVGILIGVIYHFREDLLGIADNVIDRVIKG